MENIKQSKFFLEPEERVALIESKFERAQAQVEAMIAQIEASKKLKTVYPSKDWQYQSGCRQRGPVLHYKLAQTGGPGDGSLLVESKTQAISKRIPTSVLCYLSRVREMVSRESHKLQLAVQLRHPQPNKSNVEAVVL